MKYTSKIWPLRTMIPFTSKIRPLSTTLHEQDMAVKPYRSQGDYGGCVIFRTFHEKDMAVEDYRIQSRYDRFSFGFNDGSRLLRRP